MHAQNWKQNSNADIPRGLRLALFFRDFLPGLLFGNLVSVKLLKGVEPPVEVEKHSLWKFDLSWLPMKKLGASALVEVIGKEENQEPLLRDSSGGEQRHRADTRRRVFLKAPPIAIRMFAPRWISKRTRSESAAD